MMVVVMSTMFSNNFSLKNTGYTDIPIEMLIICKHLHSSFVVIKQLFNDLSGIRYDAGLYTAVQLKGVMR